MEAAGRPGPTGVREERGGPQHSRSRPFPGLNDYWLRLTRRGDEYECAVSLDGEAFEMLALERWPAGRYASA